MNLQSRECISNIHKYKTTSKCDAIETKIIPDGDL